MFCLAIVAMLLLHLQVGNVQHNGTLQEQENVVVSYVSMLWLA